MEIRHLRRYLKDGYEFGGMLSKTAEMHRLFEIIRMVAPTEMTVPLKAKRELARSCCQCCSLSSNRSKKPFVTINCAGFLKLSWRASCSVMRRALLLEPTIAKAGKIELAHTGVYFSMN